MKAFIIEKNLFDFDTIAPPIKVRIMPAMPEALVLRSAEFTPPIKKWNHFYNIDDLTLYSPEKSGKCFEGIQQLRVSIVLHSRSCSRSLPAGDL
ncbi:MAG: hypothetical protein IPG90_09645 [Bacteroidetes bacterium]|nr:hypothetical protein [Bacteroidota bacterium]